MEINELSSLKLTSTLARSSENKESGNFTNLQGECISVNPWSNFACLPRKL